VAGETDTTPGSVQDGLQLGDGYPLSQRLAEADSAPVYSPEVIFRPFLFLFGDH
jgi:hypothetical protein